MAHHPSLFLRIITVIGSLRVMDASSCGLGFFFFNGPFSQSCLACPTDCDECYVPDIWAPVTSCTKCASGYRLVGDRCKLICPENCQTCSGVPNWFITCSECQAGFAFNSQGTDCVRCDSNCRSCTNFYRQCTDCEAGFYRDPNPPYAWCLACEVCAPGEIERSACSTTNPRWCTSCARHEVVVNNQCVACQVGTYTSDDRRSCPTCGVCSAPTHFRPNGGECTTTRNTICSACTDNKATSSNDLASCDTCNSGFFRQISGTSFVCARCTDHPCGQNQFISCSNAVRQCQTCPGVTAANACDKGKEPSKTCDGRSTEPSECRNCLAGSERPLGAVSLICEKCKTGFFKNEQSSNDCGRCTNAPANNSVYLPWGNIHANTRDCPW